MKNYFLFVLLLIFSLIDNLLATKEEQKLFRNCTLRINAYGDEECNKLCIKKPLIVIGLISNPSTRGECIREGHVIRIDPLKGDEYLTTLRHELRHVWQWTYREDVIRWTHENIERKDDDSYRYNPVEIDARHYAEFREDNGIMDIPVAVLEKMDENGKLTQKLKALLTVSLDNSGV